MKQTDRQSNILPNINTRCIEEPVLTYVSLWVHSSYLHKTFDLDITSLKPIFFQFRLLSQAAVPSVSMMKMSQVTLTRAHTYNTAAQGEQCCGTSTIVVILDTNGTDTNQRQLTISVSNTV